MSDDAKQLLLSKADERFQTLTIGDKRIVLSAEDLLSVGDNTDFDGDYRNENVYLYAGKIFLTKLRFRSGLVSSYSVSPADAAAVFSTSGDKGTDADASNQADPDVINGNPGGLLSWYTEALDPDRPYLELAARGGAGGAGLPGTESAPGGTGGNGGNGGQVLALIVHPFLALVDRLVSIYKDKNETTKREDLRLTLAGMAQTKALQAVHDKLQAALGSGGSVAALDQTLRQAGLQLQTMVETWRSTLKVDVGGGAYGTFGEGNPAGKNGLPGDPGSSSIVLARSTSELANKDFDPLFFVHPVQCSLELEKLKLMYFSADPVRNPDGVKDLATYLRRLRDRTALFADLAPEHKLAAYYREHEREFGAIDSVNSLANVHTNTNRLLDQLASGLDYFGLASGQVPLASFAFYSNLLDEQISLFSTIEKAYDDYYDKLKQNTLTMDAIRASKDQQQRLIASAESDITSLRQTLKSVGDVIASYQVTLPPLKAKVVAKLEEVENEIKDHFDFNPKAFLSSLSLLAFAPESKLMWGVVIAQTAVSGVTQITNDQGDQVNKDYLVRQIKTIDGSIESIDEGYKALDDGQLQPDDPGAGKLLALEDKLSSTLDEYYNQFPNDLDALKALFKSYVDAVMARNEQILKYNAIVLLLAKRHDVVTQGRAALAALADQTLASLEPDLPALTSFVSQSYYASRNLVMETLAMTAKSFSFWSLSDDSNLIADAYGGRALPGINAAALAVAQATILDRYSKAVEAFGSELVPFTADDETAGIMYELDADQISRFVEYGQVIVRIPVADGQTSLDDNPFADITNVRLLAVRVWVDGAATGDGKLTIDITHTGSEKIVKYDGSIFSFSHDPKGAQFRYDLKSGSVIWEGEIGWVDTYASAHGTPTSSSTYALIGPFTSWRIEARPNANRALDLSGVTAMRMEFRGKKQRLG